MTPDVARPTLSELLYTLDRATRLYRESIKHAPGELDRLGWSTLSDLAERTATQARLVLNRTTMPDRSHYDFEPPLGFIDRALGTRLHERRERLRGTSAPRPRLH
ncbi:MAG: hypothetical protein DYH18_02495 [Xanthomonadales bacterium PRO7]|nr:hypothetical protein [Xanthomonadales bacterium PRO7]